jgi:RNA polymerase sigma factor (sigma-70 family)
MFETIPQESPTHEINAKAFLDAYKKITTREKDILKLICAGHTNKEIAAKLGLSKSTVRNHISNIFAKLNVSNRTHVSIMLIKSGIME